jgi:hypothetical protein
MCGYRTPSLANPSVHSAGAASASARAKVRIYRCGTRAGDATRVGKYRLSALTELVEPRSRAMQQGAFVSRARIHHGSCGTGFWRWDRARPVIGWRTGRSSGTHRYAGCCNDLKMTSTFLRLILFIVASFLLRIQAVCREHLHIGELSDNGCRARAEVLRGATATPFVVQCPIMAQSLLSVCF